MTGDELAVEQGKAAHLQPRDEMGEGNLGGVARPAEHALAEEGAAQRDAIEATGQPVIVPHLDRMGMAAAVECEAGGLDLAIDPGLRPIVRGLCAGGDDVAEGLVDRYPKMVAADRLGERARQVEMVERQYAATMRLDPEYVGRVATVRHGKHAGGIGPEQQVDIELMHRCGG